MSEAETQSETASNNPLPLKLVLLFVVLSLLVQSGAIAYGNRVDRLTLQAAIANQAPAIDEIEKVRKQLNGIAGKTLRLAEQGNPNAARIVTQLQAAGLNFNTPASGEGGGR